MSIADRITTILISWNSSYLALSHALGYVQASVGFLPMCTECIKRKKEEKEKIKWQLIS